MKLDQKDIQILKLLQNNARLSNKEIAGKLDIAASTCHERMKRLIEEDFFTSFNANLNLKKLGFNIEVLIAVRLKKHERDVVYSFIEKIQNLSGVIRFYHLAGDKDFMIHLAVENSNSLKTFIMDELADFSDIGHIESSMIYHTECVHNLSYNS